MDIRENCIITDVTDNFVEVFGLLIVQTVEKQTILRPIGGEYGNCINDAVGDVNTSFPDCRVRILTEDNSQKYLVQNGISADRLL